MDSKASCIVLLALSCLLSTSNAFNITKILANYPDYSTFNALLTSSGLAPVINSRQTITVLAVANSAVGSVSGKDPDLVKRILSAHVILDYYDTLKLSKIKERSTILTTLYQASGVADDQQGFLNCTKTANGIMFGSAMKGAPLTSSLISSVMSQPYNISILEVSSVIEAPGIETMAPPPPPGAAAPKKAPAPATATPSEAPAPSDDDAASPSEADAPEADAPSDADTPSEAPAPEEAADADAPASTPTEADSEEVDADADAPSSGSSRIVVAGGLAVAGLVANVLGF